MRAKGRWENTGNEAFKREFFRVKTRQRKETEALKWHLVLLIFPQGLAHWFFYKEQLGISYVSALSTWDSHSMGEDGSLLRVPIGLAIHRTNTRKIYQLGMLSFTSNENIVNSVLNRLLYLSHKKSGGMQPLCGFNTSVTWGLMPLWFFWAFPQCSKIAAIAPGITSTFRVEDRRWKWWLGGSSWEGNPFCKFQADFHGHLNEAKPCRMPLSFSS